MWKTLTNSHSFIGCESSYDEAGIVIFGAPFDGTTSYRPGHVLHQAPFVVKVMV